MSELEAQQQRTRSSKSSPNTIAAYLHKHGYRMGNVLGEGSYSKVRLCTRYFSDGTKAYCLACKVINKQRASEDFVQKFLPRELEIVTRIEHPNIVRVFDVVEFDQQVYIFMDCCDKGDLLEYVKAKGMISENRSRHYYRQIASAIEYLHKQDIAHRDLKCENVLMAPRDQIRISDFGFSRYCRDKEGRRVLSNTYCGSAAYAAPEILQGTMYNPKLYDMWSLGCVLFIMLTGHMPYDESDIPKMLRNQVERVLIYPSQAESRISESAKNLVRRLLEPDVVRRANIEQAKFHEWVGPCDYYEAGDGAGVGNENMYPPSPSRTRSEAGSSTSTSQRLGVAGDHEQAGLPKPAERGRIRPQEGFSSSKTGSPHKNKRGSAGLKTPSSNQTTPPTTMARQSSKSYSKSLKQPPEGQPIRNRTAMSGVTNLLHMVQKASTRSSRNS